MEALAGGVSFFSLLILLNRDAGLEVFFRLETQSIVPPWGAKNTPTENKPTNRVRVPAPCNSAYL